MTTEEVSEKPKKKHRSTSKRYDKNEIVECACGCGQSFTRCDIEGRPRKYISGHNGRKYDDPTQFKREWNHRNREQRAEAKAARRIKLRIKLIKLMGSKCLDCGLEYDGTNGAAFHIHHLDKNMKSFEIGPAIINRSWASVLEEAKKCVLLCANHHTLRHSKPY